MRSWLGGRTAATPEPDDADEPQALQAALHASSFIMDDDLEKADEELSKGSSAFHKLGLGLVAFTRAVLGFEKEIIAKAQEKLTEAETEAYERHRRAKRLSTSGSKIYSHGTEYLLCQAQAQIMLAILGVMSETVTETIKAFYRLRKAYVTLDQIVQEEQKYLETLDTPPEDVDGANTPTSASKLNVTSEGPQDPADEDEWVDAAESPPEIEVTSAMEKVDLNGTVDPRPLLREPSQIQDGPDTEIFSNFLDSVIHSSSNMWFGLLLILISMTPPALNTLSKIIGFKGDRKRGIAMLWQATKFNNLNGAFAGLALLGFYNGFTSFCDILPKAGSQAFPAQRVKALLETYRRRYPTSCLWLLEESRMRSINRSLEESLKLLNGMPKSGLVQVTALQCFQISMNSMFLHRYESCAASFQKMITLNNWSHGLYYYIAASCHVERYRELLESDPEKAAEQAEKATKLLQTIPSHLGKKRIMARQLPFDVFVGRKIQKWEQRAKDHDVDLVDAVGVSPVEEMIYFWNGFKQMQPDELKLSLRSLALTESRKKIPWEDDAVDEHAIHAVIKAAVLRNLKMTAEARKTLADNVFAHDKNLLKGGLKDNWTCPVAHYEHGVTHWADYLESGELTDLEECQSWLAKSAAWETYDLDARIGMRVKTGQNTVQNELEIR